MELPKISIRDSLFSHAYSSSNWFKPTSFEWDFKNINGDVLFFTDKNLHEAKVCPPNIKKYAWLVESPVVTPDAYKYAFENATDFDLIFTHSKKLLELPNAKFLPIGGCHLNENEISMDYEKTKLVSMMYSFKKFAPGHELRFEIADKLSNFIDIMGSGKTGQHVKKIHSCKDYGFSVVIENCKEDFYFTEKIIDCFLTGTVPIYWGCPSIDHFFSRSGMLTFSSFDELKDLVSSKETLIEFYSNNAHHIINNFDAAMKYKIAEDYLWQTYQNIL